MVLAELGGKLRESLRKLSSNSEPLDESALNSFLSEIARALIEADVNVKLVMSLREQVKSKVAPLVLNNNNSTHVKRVIQREVIQALTDLLETDTKPYVMKRGKSNVVLFVGLQGAGKTTSIAKFANYYQRKGWKTAMVCADTFRAGAFDQLKQNATKLRVPFYGSYTEADPVLIAEEGVNQFKRDKYEVIIVDTSGRHRQESALFEEMQEIAAAIRPHNTVFVMDATQGQAVYDQAMGFHDAVEVGSVIVTKLDGHAKGGGALSAVSATQSPIIFLGSGEHFNDFDPFNARSFVSKLLGFGDVRGLMEEMKQSQGGAMKQEELIQKFKKGKFTLRDMRNQFESVMKMGPMSKVMGMIPGMPEQLIPQNDDENNSLKKFMYIMDSMTDAELDGKADLHNYKKDKKSESRIRRIAIGSGTHPDEVRLLLQAHKQMESVASKVGKSGMLKKGGAEKRAAAAMKNPNAMMQQMRNMNPQQAKMLEQMGGPANLMNMMKQMGGAGGMERMMQQMGGMGGMPGAGGAGGMPDMAQMAQMMQQMGMGGMPPGGGGRR